jgi:hypothetical protein
LSACSPIRIFQREMSDAPDTFGPMIMHVLCMCTAMDITKHLHWQLQGQWRKKCIHTFDSLYIRPLVVSMSL